MFRTSISQIDRTAKKGNKNTKRQQTKKVRLMSRPHKEKDLTPDTSRTITDNSYQYRDNLKVEPTLKKNKKVKESDVFEFSKKNESKPKK